MYKNYNNHSISMMLNEFENELNYIHDDYISNNISLEDCIGLLNWLRMAWSLSRIDIKNNGNENQINILNYDKNLNITFPVWFCDQRGQGSKIESTRNKFEFSFECINDGYLEIFFKGVDYRNRENNFLPVYFNFTSIKINGNEILDEEKLVWHNKFFKYDKQCNNKEVISINASYKTIYDYFPSLNNLLLNINNQQDLEQAFESIKEYINDEKMLIQSQKLSDNSNGVVSENQDIYLLNKNIKELSLKFDKYKKETDEILNSYHLIFNNLLIYQEIRPKELVKLSRELTVQLLDFIDNVCKKHDLNWWLYAGTLLGAIRHQGFIPWDDDCDINMLRTDYNKFFEVVTDEIKKHNLSDNMEVNKSTVTNNNVHLPFIKFNYWVGNDLFSFIDIFPTDYARDIIPNLELIFKEEWNNNQMKLRNGENLEKVLNDSFNRLHVSNEKTNILFSGIEDPNISIHEYESVFPLTYLEFEDRKYPCPKDYRTYISKEYGFDYMKLPKKIETHEFYEYLSRRQNVYEILKQEIKKLKEVNENF